MPTHKKSYWDSFRNSKDYVTNGGSQQIIYQTDDGRYVLDNDEEVTPLAKVGDDVSQWSYIGKNGKIYTPHRTENSGTISAINPFSKQAQTLREDAALNEKEKNATFLTKGLYSAIRNWREGKTPMQALASVGLMPNYDSENVAGIGDLIGISKLKELLGRTKTATKFKSELDWSPKDYFTSTRRTDVYDDDDVRSLTSHVPEYLDIERTAKENGTWLKMPDGSTYIGDPRGWVMMQSKAFKKGANNKVYYHGDDNFWGKGNTTDLRNSERLLWGNTNPLVGRSYTQSDEKLIPFVVSKNSKPISTIDAGGRNWRAAYNKDGKYLDTNVFSRENLTDENYVLINNVIDPGPSSTISKSIYYPKNIDKKMSYYDFLEKYMTGDDIVIGKGTPRKAILGNNGDFNWNISNMYKSLFPIGLGLSIGATANNNK